VPRRVDNNDFAKSYECFNLLLQFERQPISVTYDARSIRLNDQPVIFLSGSLHPARATVHTWEHSLDEAVEIGLNMITIYIIWAARQPSKNAPMDWSFPKPELSSWADKEWDLVWAISSAASRGLFAHLRIGPYVCAEYSYGEIPEWLALSYRSLIQTCNVSFSIHYDD